jgi:hypothetical protein
MMNELINLQEYFYHRVNMKYDELVFKICAHNHLDLALDHLFWLGCLVGLGGIFNLDWLISALVSLRLFSGIISKVSFK